MTNAVLVIQLTNRHSRTADRHMTREPGGSATDLANPVPHTHTTTRTTAATGNQWAGTLYLLGCVQVHKHCDRNDKVCDFFGVGNVRWQGSVISGPSSSAVRRSTCLDTYIHSTRNLPLQCCIGSGSLKILHGSVHAQDIEFDSRGSQR